MKDITIGQYFPGKSFVHRLDSKSKIICGMFYLVLLFLSSNTYSLIIGVSYITIALLISKMPLRILLKSIKPMILLISISVVFNMLLTDGQILWSLGFLKITDRGILAAIYMTIRMFCLIFGTYMFTYTTSTTDITYGIESLLSPLKKLEVPVDDIAMIMTIALRFIPVLGEEIGKILEAQKARGAYFDDGNIFLRIKSRVPIIIPLFMAAFQRADELALAMECRGYTGKKRKTKTNLFKFKKMDVVIMAITFLLLVFVIVLNYILPKAFY